MSVQKRLLHLRKENRMSQAQVAEALNVSRQAVSRWEAGISLPSTENLQCLSQLYGVPMDALLNEPADKAADPPRAQTDEEAPKPGKRPSARLLALAAAFLLLLGIAVAVWTHGTSKEAIDLKELQGEEVEGLTSIEFDLEW